MVEKHSVNTISHPRLRLPALLAAPALVATACGPSEETSGDEVNASVEGDSPDTDAGGSGEEGSPDTPSLAEPGILTAECETGLGFIDFTLFSADEGDEILTVRFSTTDATYTESEDLSHGRAVDTDDLSLVSACEKNAPPLFPERHLVLATFTEEVNGNDVSGFGVLSEDRTFTALSPEQEVSDFATPTNYIHPVADPERDRILFVEDQDGTEPTVQALDMESGEITDLGGCDGKCDYLTVMPGIDAAVFENDPSQDLTVVLDGSTVVDSDSGGTLFFFDFEDQIGADPIDLTHNTMKENRSPLVKVDVRGHIQAIDANTLLFSDNVLSVKEITADIADEYESANEGLFEHQWDRLPVDRTLIPEGTRTNSRPLVSPDSSEVLFHSEPETGPASWYRVPTDGSTEPEEFPALPGGLSTIIGWT